MEIRKCWVLNHKVFVVAAVQPLSRVWLFETSWTAARQAPLSFTISWSLLKFMSIELMMPSNHLILCHPLLLLPSIFPSIKVFSTESALHIRWPKYWSFSFNISPSNEYTQSTRSRLRGTVRIRIKASPPSTEKETEFGNTFLPTHLKLFSPYSKNGFLGGSVVKNPPANARGSGDTDSIPRSGKSPGGGNGNPPQYSFQEYPTDRGTWWAIVHGVTKSQTWLSTFPNYFSYHQRCPLTLRNTVLIYELGHRYSEKEESASCRRHWEMSKKDEGGRGIRKEGRQGSHWHEHTGKWKTIQLEQRCSSGKEGNEVRWVEQMLQSLKWGREALT